VTVAAGSQLLTNAVDPMRCRAALLIYRSLILHFCFSEMTYNVLSAMMLNPTIPHLDNEHDVSNSACRRLVPHC